MTTPSDRLSRVTELLASLVRIDSINPMGRPYARSQPVERAAIETIEGWFAPHLGPLACERQACGEFHENLVVTLPGPIDRGALLMESHIDTVPADDWADRALQPVVREGTLVGRGACDDKGCLAAMILALLEILEEKRTPPHPLVLLCAADEEYGQTGIRRYLDGNSIQFAGGVFGEPTQLAPVVQHKGVVRWDVTVHGTSAHTSRPELGTNAITGMIEAIAALHAHEDRLQAESRNPHMKTGPTITVTMIQGGRTRNAVPDLCTAAVDFRIDPETDPLEEHARVVSCLDRLAWRITHSPLQSQMPPLSTNPKSRFCQQVLEICRQVASKPLDFEGAPYGTDAAWMSVKCPAIVLGPGDIAHAHAIDERIDLGELVQAVEIYKQIMLQPLQ